LKDPNIPFALTRFVKTPSPINEATVVVFADIDVQLENAEDASCNFFKFAIEERFPVRRIHPLFILAILVRLVRGLMLHGEQVRPESPNHVDAKDVTPTGMAHMDMSAKSFVLFLNAFAIVFKAVVSGKILVIVILARNPRATFCPKENVVTLPQFVTVST